MTGRTPIDMRKGFNGLYGSVRDRLCWHYDWIVDLDIKVFFDSIDWGLLLRAVRTHAPNRWVVLYVERWLKAQR